MTEKMPVQNEKLPTPSEIAEVVREKYKETEKKSDGYLVIDRSQLIRYVDLGAQRMMSIHKPDDVEGREDLDLFLPPEMPRDTHERYVEQKFRDFEEALTSKEGKEFSGGFMATAKGAAKARTVSLMTLDRPPQKKSVAIEFQGIFILKEKVTHLYMVAFLYEQSETQAAQSPITAIEGQNVIRDGRVALVSNSMDEGGRKFVMGYRFLRDEVFRGFPAASLLSFMVMSGVAIGFFSIVIYLVVALWPGRKPPVIQHIQQTFSEPFADDEPPPEHRPEPKRQHESGK